MDVCVLINKTIEPAPGLLGGEHKPTSQNMGVFNSLEECYNFAKNLLDKEVIFTKHQEWKELIEVENEFIEYNSSGTSVEIFYGTSPINYTIDGKPIITKEYLVIQKFELNNNLL